MALDKNDIDQIRTLFAEGLEELVLPKLDTINARLDALTNRTDALEARYESVERRFESVERRLERVEHRLEKVEGSLADPRTNQTELIEAIQSKKIITQCKADTLRERRFGQRTA